MANRNSDGLRNRRPKSSDNSGEETNRDATVTEKTASDDQKKCKGNTNKHRRSILKTAMLVLLSIAHLAAIACFVGGIILRTSRLHNGDECDMTWSIRIFLEVDTSDMSTKQKSHATKDYRLYKFIDQRDLRYQQQLRARIPQIRAGNPVAPLERDDHCYNNNVVVYVPGHWGSYDQARSLGAHGIGLSRSKESQEFVKAAQQTMLSTLEREGSAHHHPDDFIYDVYALDFSGQGGGLHGQLLRYQSDYLAAVLKQLTEDCPVLEQGGSRTRNRILVVAHSMGGYVARKVLLEHPELRVENLVTLATPHSNPLYAFDKSVANFHQELLEQSRRETNAPLVVSIAGGLKDEMIEPSACQVPEDTSLNSSSASILATKLVAKAESSSFTAPPKKGDEIQSKAKKVDTLPLLLLGMDHRAIVWCHQLLEEVRKVLWVLTAASWGTTEQRLDKVRKAVGTADVLDYPGNLREMNRGLEVMFGHWQAIFMEASMLYNLPYLLALYALSVGFRSARTSRSGRATSVVPVWATILLGWIFRSDLSWMSTVILAFVANSVNLVLVYLLPVGFILRRRRQKKGSPQKQPLQTIRDILVEALVLFLVVIIGAVIVCRSILGLKDSSFIINNWTALLDVGLYVYMIVSIYIMLVVWAGFIEDDSKKAALGKSVGTGSGCFEIQLITFVMMVVPVTIAGSLHLIAWEQKTQLSSWLTLLSLQIPVAVLVLTKLSQTRIHERNDSITTKKHSMARSILVYLSVFALCCLGPGLLSRGTGYLVPKLAFTLICAEIMSTKLTARQKNSSEGNDPIHIILTGASGYLGQHLLSNWIQNGILPSAPGIEFQITALYHKSESFPGAVKKFFQSLPQRNDILDVKVLSVDLTDSKAIDTWIKSEVGFSSTIVIHAAALSSPKACQANPESAKAINVPTKFFDAVLASTSASIFALSTDQVYDGRQSAGSYYNEDDTEGLNPVNVYGETKLELEKYLQQQQESSSITSPRNSIVALRSSIILGPQAPIASECAHGTFLDFCKSRGEQQEETTFFTNEYRSVVRVDTVINTIGGLVSKVLVSNQSQASVVYNMGGAFRFNRMELAKAVFDKFGYDPNLLIEADQTSPTSPLDISMDSSLLVDDKVLHNEDWKDSETYLKELVDFVFDAE